MELKIIDDKGQSSATMTVSDSLFDREFNESLVHQILVAYKANARSASSKQKDREEVHHSTKKPFRQKGTGRARAGMTSSPLWRGGGRIFPNSPDENFTQKINRKMYRVGVATILSQLVREGRLSVVETFTIDQPKTRLVVNKLRELGLGRVLVITDVLDENLILGVRNLPNAIFLEPHQTDPVSLIRYPRVLMTRSAVSKIEEMFA